MRAQDVSGIPHCGGQNWKPGKSCSSTDSLPVFSARGQPSAGTESFSSPGGPMSALSMTETVLTCCGRSDIPVRAGESHTTVIS